MRHSGDRILQQAGTTSVYGEGRYNHRITPTVRAVLYLLHTYHFPSRLPPPRLPACLTVCARTTNSALLLPPYHCRAISPTCHHTLLYPPWRTGLTVTVT